MYLFFGFSYSMWHAALHVQEVMQTLTGTKKMMLKIVKQACHLRLVHICGLALCTDWTKAPQVSLTACQSAMTPVHDSYIASCAKLFVQEKLSFALGEMYIPLSKLHASRQCPKNWFFCDFTVTVVCMGVKPLEMVPANLGSDIALHTTYYDRSSLSYLLSYYHHHVLSYYHTHQPQDGSFSCSISH